MGGWAIFDPLFYCGLWMVLKEEKKGYLTVVLCILIMAGCLTIAWFSFTKAAYVLMVILVGFIIAFIIMVKDDLKKVYDYMQLETVRRVQIAARRANADSDYGSLPPGDEDNESHSSSVGSRYTNLTSGFCSASSSIAPEIVVVAPNMLVVAPEIEAAAPESVSAAPESVSAAPESAEDSEYRLSLNSLRTTAVSVLEEMELQRIQSNSLVSEEIPFFEGENLNSVEEMHIGLVRRAAHFPIPEEPPKPDLVETQSENYRMDSSD